LPKIYIVGDNKTVTNWFSHEIVKDPTDADLAIFTGGEDVSPYLYGEKPNFFTRSNLARDAREISFYEIFKMSDIRMLGICRGAQFLCVMEGGKLIQHVNNHGRNHKMHMNGVNLEITSTHHQMMFPFSLKEDYYDIIAYTEGLSDLYQSENGDFIMSEDEERIFVEPEIVQFGNDVLCIQGHPEYMEYGHKTNKHLRDLLHDFLIYDDYL